MTTESHHVTAGRLAYALAEFARETIGPSGTIKQVSEEDAPLVRTMLIGGIADAASRIVNNEDDDRGEQP